MLNIVDYKILPMICTRQWSSCFTFSLFCFYLFSFYSMCDFAYSLMYVENRPFWRLGMCYSEFRRLCTLFLISKSYYNIKALINKLVMSNDLMVTRVVTQMENVPYVSEQLRRLIVSGIMFSACIDFLGNYCVENIDRYFPGRMVRWNTYYLTSGKEPNH